MTQIANMPLANDADLVHVRQSVRRVCERMGIEAGERTRFATAVSEITRNALVHGGGGVVDIEIAEEKSLLRVIVRDRGPGIPDDVWLGGRGTGFVAARKLVELVDVVNEGGARVTLSCALPASHSLDAATVEGLRAAVQQDDERSAREELMRQNRELVDAFATLQAREEELARLNRELAETNSGVLALYRELEEQTEAVRRAAEAKTRFYTEMNHELRTPLNAIIGFSEILTNGSISEPDAMRRPLGFLRKSAQQMAELVDDLLDLARVEAGKMSLRVSDFAVDDVVGTLRGLFRPLHTNENVHLVFESGQDAGVMRSDEGKLAQILRNLVSNALKFTDAGEVRVTITSTAGEVSFAVTDTGVGIAPHDQERLFQAFSRVESAKHRQVKGTGLGLAVSRRLATLLGGRVEIESTVGKGSTFKLTLPRAVAPEQDRSILVIDDDEVARYLLKDLLRTKGVAIREASSGSEGLAMIASHRPSVVLLDLNMPDMSGYEVLEAMRADAAMADLPVIINTSQPLTENERGALGRKTLAILTKDGSARASTQAALERALASLGF